MEKRGEILATDRRKTAIQELKRRVRIARVNCIAWRQADIRSAGPAPSSFDGVLVDAPCSGIGTWSRNPDARWRLPTKEIAHQHKLQSQLMIQAAKAVKPGGTLVYSVCTLTRTETIDVIEAFLAEHPDFHLTPVKHPLTGEPTDGKIWIWPWEGPCDGMFIARLQR
jgi:16S rRNA (cytosine967-C5)-methyltransferase